MKLSKEHQRAKESRAKVVSTVRTMLVPEAAVCAICQDPLLNVDDQGEIVDVAYFKCKHTYHTLCLEQWREYGTRIICAALPPTSCPCCNKKGYFVRCDGCIGSSAGNVPIVETRVVFRYKYKGTVRQFSKMTSEQLFGSFL